MTIAAAPPPSSSIHIGPYHCHYCRRVGIGCSTSNGIANSLIKSPVNIHKIADNSGLRCENLIFGVGQCSRIPNGHQNHDLKVLVAADYSDSLPEYSNFSGESGYHPFEELKKYKNIQATKLTSAEIARTTVEASNRALLLFPATIHSEPHEQISWAEYRYVVDEFGDVFLEIHEGENILQDPEAINPVNVLIGMGIPQYENRRIHTSERVNGYGDDMISDDDYFEFENSEMMLDAQVDWGMPGSSSWVHPTYFAKCLVKAVDEECLKLINHPSNGVSLLGHLRPAYIDEEAYIRGLFDNEATVTDSWTDGEAVNFSSYNQDNGRSSIYRFEILKIELFSIYGGQLAIGLEDFQDAEPDILVHSAPALVEYFTDQGAQFFSALKALCKKKGLLVEGANLIGIDSLGMDVRVFSGSEAVTLRFPFKVRATSESAAEKQIQQLLFPRSWRKKFRSLDKLSDIDSF